MGKTDISFSYGRVVNIKKRKSIDDESPKSSRKAMVVRPCAIWELYTRRMLFYKKQVEVEKLNLDLQKESKIEFTKGTI